MPPLVFMFMRWNEEICRMGPGLTLMGEVGDLSQHRATMDRPCHYLPFIMIFKRIRSWVRRTVTAIRNRVLYAPGGVGYLEVRQRFRYNQGLRATRAQKRKWGT